MSLAVSPASALSRVSACIASAGLARGLLPGSNVSSRMPQSPVFESVPITILFAGKRLLAQRQRSVSIVLREYLLQSRNGQSCRQLRERATDI